MPTSSRHWFRFSIRSLLVALAFCAIGLGWFVDRAKIEREHTAELEKLKAPHSYGITVSGTPGVRLEMTLVTKPATIRREIVTVPFSLNFEAVRAAVWFETLPEGKSGGDGDNYTIVLEKDGVPGSECRGHIQKDSRDWMYQNGDVKMMLGDF